MQYIINIPKEGRSGSPLRPCFRGLSLPSTFLDQIKSIDKDIYPIWHPFRVIWDDFMNSYYGSPDDPRFTIGEFSGFEGQEIWGFPLKGIKDTPIDAGAWHLWRFSRPAGAWNHLIKLDSNPVPETGEKQDLPCPHPDPDYLQQVVNRLYIQASYRDQYGDLAWNKKLREDEQEEKIKAQKKQQEEFSDVQKANKGLLKTAMENMERGIVNPTNPVKEIITSYSGQKNHTKIVRPITDKEGGIII